jgi:hypothetical protein
VLGVLSQSVPGLAALALAALSGPTRRNDGGSAGTLEGPAVGACAPCGQQCAWWFRHGRVACVRGRSVRAHVRLKQVDTPRPRDRPQPVLTPQEHSGDRLRGLQSLAICGGEGQASRPASSRWFARQLGGFVPPRRTRSGREEGKKDDRRDELKGPPPRCGPHRAAAGRESQERAGCAGVLGALPRKRGVGVCKHRYSLRTSRSPAYLAQCPPCSSHANNDVEHGCAGALVHEPWSYLPRNQKQCNAS